MHIHSLTHFIQKFFGLVESEGKDCFHENWQIFNVISFYQAQHRGGTRTSLYLFRVTAILGVRLHHSLEIERGLIAQRSEILIFHNAIFGICVVCACARIDFPC
jgi:sulfur relay (sulfurtransferase) complex TusBCD TusD component (DsrE family)